MITGYSHFVTLAESLQWDETAIDYSADREAWPQLTATENAKVLGLIAGFAIAEASVSVELGSYEAAASDDSMEAVFRAQARDEARPPVSSTSSRPRSPASRGPAPRSGGTLCAPTSVRSLSTCSSSDCLPPPSGSPRTTMA